MPFRIIFFIFTAYFLFFGGTSAFRDGAHFYPPLFQYQLEEIFAGRFPLWNPYENIGQPQAANPTSMLFYPGFYLAALPSVFSWLTGTVPFRTAAPYYITCGYAMFLQLHILLCLWTSYRLARVWGCSRNASTLAAVCYTLSGSVLFQWNNAPFLVAAALFPETIRTVFRLLQKKQLKYAVRYAVLLTLMITGGDPQSAYHSVMCAGVFFVFEFFIFRKYAKNVDDTKKNTKNVSLRPLCLCVILFIFADILTFLLSAILILPAMELSCCSDRSLPEFEDYVYWFSVPPWRLLELCFPNIGGQQFPINTRWFDALPENGIWTPSLYMGMLPIILAGFGLYCARRHRDIKTSNDNYNNSLCLPCLCAQQNYAAAVLLVIFLLGSLGNWFFVYPAMRYLPLYDSFRYPGKLMTAATLFLAVFAAIGFDWVFCKDGNERKNRCALLMKIYAASVFIVSLVILAVLCLPLNVPASVLFGPFDKREECYLLVKTFCFISIFCSVIFIFYRRENNKSGTLLRSAVKFEYLVLVVILADLCVHNYWFFTVSPIESKNALPQNTAIIDTIRQNKIISESVSKRSPVPVRIYRFPYWEPQCFGEDSSPNRIAETKQWNKAALFPKYTVPLRLNVVDVRGTMMPKEYYRFTQELRSQLEDKWGQTISSPYFIEHLEEAGVEYIIAPKNVKLDAEKISLPYSAPPDVSLWKLKNPAERQFMVYEPNRCEIEVVLEKPKMIVITEQHWSGWRTFDNGREIPVKNVDWIFRGVDLSAGKHHIVMIYDPPLLKIGAVLSVIGLIIVVLSRGIICFRLQVR